MIGGKAKGRRMASARVRVKDTSNAHFFLSTISVLNKEGVKDMCYFRQS